MRKQRILCAVFLAAILFVGCSNPALETRISPFLLHNPGQMELSGQRFSLNDDTSAPIIMLFDSARDAEQYWQSTGKWIGFSGYQFLLVTSWKLGSNDSIKLSGLLAQKFSQKSVRAAVAGVGPGAEIAVRLVAADSNLKALITIDAVDYLGQPSIDLLENIPPRPHLLIETTLNPQHPDQRKVALFEKAHDPKKMVWLATGRNPSEILRSDLEPIVRRTVLLLTDRYLKKAG